MNYLQRRWLRRLLKGIGIVMAVICLALVVFANFFLAPLLSSKLQAVIVQGSDSLYVYSLGGLDASVMGGDITVRDLNIRVDSGRYRRRQARNDLPPLVVKLNLRQAKIEGVGFLDLLSGRKLHIRSITSTDADLVLSRQIPEGQKITVTPPLWKSIRPAIGAIWVDRVKLDGLKLLYKPADTAQSVKLQFDRFDALVEDIRIDSAGAFDTSRLGFAKDIWFRFHDMKFRTADSSYKMKAEYITYSSKNRTVEVDSFKLQPTLDKEAFYQRYGVQASLFYVEFDKIRFTNASLDRFINRNIVEADSVVIRQPSLRVYTDKTQEKIFASRIGQYPHQKLLQAATRIRLRRIDLRNAAVTYTEKNGITGLEGTVKLQNVSLQVQNAVNEPEAIRANPVCTAQGEGTMLGGSPLRIGFRFYLDSANGRFDADGEIRNVGAAALNEVALPLANTQIPTLNLHRLSFAVRGQDYDSWSDVQMHYDNLSLVLLKRDTATGKVSTRSFLTKLVNRYAIYPSNPDAGGERTARNVRHMRLTTEAFFGLIWKSIFAGMQEVVFRG